MGLMNNLYQGMKKGVSKAASYSANLIREGTIRLDNLGSGRKVIDIEARQDGAIIPGYNASTSSIGRQRVSVRTGLGQGVNLSPSKSYGVGKKGKYHVDDQGGLRKVERAGKKADRKRFSDPIEIGGLEYGLDKNTERTTNAGIPIDEAVPLHEYRQAAYSRQSTTGRLEGIYNNRKSMNLTELVRHQKNLTRLTERPTARIRGAEGPTHYVVRNDEQESYKLFKKETADKVLASFNREITRRKAQTSWINEVTSKEYLASHSLTNLEQTLSKLKASYKHNAVKSAEDHIASAIAIINEEVGYQRLKKQLRIRKAQLRQTKESAVPEAA